MEFTTKKDLIKKIRRLAPRTRVFEELSILVKNKLGIFISESTLRNYITDEEKKMMRENLLANPRSRKKYTYQSEEIRNKMVGLMIGKSGPESIAWKGGSSFLPYCHLFNEILREEIRNRDS
jgi:putative ubiquitin-RnfH superfamily antitoxin RatB of RatAB toxin-antitoxin module